RSTLPLRLPEPCMSQYVSRCQRSARLAHLRGPGGAFDQKGKKALFWRTNRCRTTTKRLCTRFDNHRSLFESFSLGTLSLHQSRDQTPYSTRPTWTDSFLYRNYRWALPRRQRTGCVDGRAGSFLRHGSWLPRLLPPSHTPSSRRLLCHPCPQRSAFVRYVSQPIDPDTGLCSDHIGRLQGFYSRKDFPDKLRLVRFYDTVQDRRFCFLTNQLLLPALTICQLYKMRWQVELFFKWIKQHLRIKRFYGNSMNAVKTQVWIAVSVYVLVAILKKELQLPQGLHSILQILSVSTFEKVPLNQLLTTTLSQNYETEDHNQLMLWDL